MKNLFTESQGVQGGNVKRQKIGFTAILSSSDKIISVDNFHGSGGSYKQREEPIICIFGETSNDVLFEGTHQQLVALLVKNEQMLNPLKK